MVGRTSDFLVYNLHQLFMTFSNTKKKTIIMLFFLRNAMSLRVKYSVICLLKSINGLTFTMAMTMKNCQTCLMFCYQNSVSVSNIYVQTVIQKCGQRNRRSSNRQTDKQTDGQTSGRTDEQVYGQTDTTTMHLSKLELI